MTDEKTAFFRVKFQSTIDEERVINIVAQDMPQGFYRSLQKVRENESGLAFFLLNMIDEIIMHHGQ